MRRYPHVTLSLIALFINKLFYTQESWLLLVFVFPSFYFIRQYKYFNPSSFFFFLFPIGGTISWFLRSIIVVVSNPSSKTYVFVDSPNKITSSSTSYYSRSNETRSSSGASGASEACKSDEQNINEVYFRCLEEFTKWNRLFCRSYENALPPDCYIYRLVILSVRSTVLYVNPTKFHSFSSLWISSLIPYSSFIIGVTWISYV